MRIGLGPFLPGMHLTASEAAQFATIIRKFGKYEQSRGQWGAYFLKETNLEHSKWEWGQIYNVDESADAMTENSK